MSHKLNYEEFIEMIRKRIVEEFSIPEEGIKFYPKGFTSEDKEELEFIRDFNQRQCERTADELLADALVIEKPKNNAGKTVCNRFQAHDLFEIYLEQGMEQAYAPISENQRRAEIIYSDNNTDKLKVLMTNDYNKIKEHLILKPLNYGLHIRELKERVYWRISDIVLALYFLVSDTEITVLTNEIRKEDLINWGMADQENEIMQAALENTMRLYPPTVYNYSTNNEVNVLQDEFEGKDIMEQGFPDTLLSTHRVINGAMALFYPGVVERMMKAMDGPFQAVFMNVNDVMLVKRNSQNAKEYVKAARKQGEMAEMLSRKIYLCDEDGVHPI